jgi:hypothetical protein
MISGVRKRGFPAFSEDFPDFFRNKGDNAPTMKNYTRKRINKGVKNRPVFAFSGHFS